MENMAYHIVAKYRKQGFHDKKFLRAHLNLYVRNSSDGEFNPHHIKESAICIFVIVLKSYADDKAWDEYCQSCKIGLFQIADVS